MNRREFLQTSLGGAALAAAPIYLDAADAAAGGRGVPTNGQGHQSELLTLRKEAETLGKPEWREVLLYLATLREKGTHPGQPAFPFEWEEIGIGYHARAFGHWDIVHIVLDVLSSMPIHARHQILNNLANQQADGLVPGSIYLERQWVDGKERYVPDYNRTAGHPALWPFAVQAYYDHTGDTSLIAPCCEALLRQIQWFETHRKAKPAGYWYSRTQWESGVDDDLRNKDMIPGPDNALACIDATSHVYAMHAFAADWGKLLGTDASEYAKKAALLKAFIQNDLYDKGSGYFYDQWSVHETNRVESYVGMWPVVVGAATKEQAKSVVEKYLLNPDKFFTPHPITSIGVKDPQFELLTFHGPAWNSMTYWAASGCVRYGYKDAARRLLERALDNSGAQFKRTGTIWEFYHPFVGKQEDLKREVTPPHLMPCRDYAGHNPLFAMARLYDRLKKE